MLFDPYKIFLFSYNLFLFTQSIPCKLHYVHLLLCGHSDDDDDKVPTLFVTKITKVFQYFPQPSKHFSKTFLELANI